MRGAKRRRLGLAVDEAEQTLRGIALLVRRRQEAAGAGEYPVISKLVECDRRRGDDRLAGVGQHERSDPVAGIRRVVDVELEEFARGALGRAANCAEVDRIRLVVQIPVHGHRVPDETAARDRAEVPGRVAADEGFLLQIVDKQLRGGRRSGRGRALRTGPEHEIPLVRGRRAGVRSTVATADGDHTGRSGGESEIGVCQFRHQFRGGLGIRDVEDNIGRARCDRGLTAGCEITEPGARDRTRQRKRRSAQSHADHHDRAPAIGVSAVGAEDAGIEDAR